MLVRQSDRDPRLVIDSNGDSLYLRVSSILLSQPQELRPLPSVGQNIFSNDDVRQRHFENQHCKTYQDFRELETPMTITHDRYVRVIQEGAFQEGLQAVQWLMPIRYHLIKCRVHRY
jgi:hypothetical protein